MLPNFAASAGGSSTRKRTSRRSGTSNRPSGRTGPRSLFAADEERDRRRDRRTDAACADQPRLSIRARSRTSSRSSSARTRSAPRSSSTRTSPPALVPLDVTALNVDFAVGGSVKWLCGGPGAGWLDVRPDLAATLEPTLVGWQAHARPFGFEPELEYAEGAARFLTGTPNVPGALRGDGGLRHRRGDRGRPDPRATRFARPELLDGPARRGGLRGRAARATRNGEAVRSSSARPTSRPCTRELDRRQIICDFRPDVGLRLGPHFFTTDEEIELAVSAMREIVAGLSGGRGGRKGPAGGASRAVRARFAYCGAVGSFSCEK